MRRKLTTLLAKSGHSQNGAPRQLVDEAVYREHSNFVSNFRVLDTEYSGWSNASRPKDQAISLRSKGSGSGTTFTVGVTVAGFNGTGDLILLLNGADPLSIGANGAFTFSTPLPNGVAYEITVSSVPVGAELSPPTGNPTNNPGVISGANVTSPVLTLAPIG